MRLDNYCLRQAVVESSLQNKDPIDELKARGAHERGMVRQRFLDFIRIVFLQ